jgi:superfamily II DNA or RNA helicase
MKILRNYQQEDKNAVFAALKAGQSRQLGVQATGLGKTLLGSHILNEFPGRALWLTHTIELIDQSAKAILRERMDIEDSLDNHDNIVDFLNDKATAGMFANPLHKKIRQEIGIIKQERMDLDARLQVASVQTIHRRLAKIPKDHYDIIIVDEAHMAMAATWQKTLDHFTPKLRLGLTATPERTDGLSLGNLFDDITFQRDIKFGIEEGYLVPLNGIRIKTEINIDTIKTTGGDFNLGDAERLLNTPQRNNLIAESWKKYAEKRPTIGFCVDVKHAQDITDVFQSHGISATFVVADEKVCPDRFERIKAFKEGKYDVMFNVMILTAGFDFPEVSCILMARPTKSKTLFLQAVGRGTRPVNTKELALKTIAQERVESIQESSKNDCIILDIVDATNRHQLVNTYTLDREKDPEDRVFITREKKKKLIEEREAKKSKLLHTLKQDERVELIAIPSAKKMKANANTLRPATTPQIDFLKREGVYQEGVEYTLRDAFEAISNQPATIKQINALRRMGYNATENLTRGQADAAFADHKERQEKQEITKIINRLPISGIE